MKNDIEKYLGLENSIEERIDLDDGGFIIKKKKRNIVMFYEPDTKFIVFYHRFDKNNKWIKTDWIYED